MVFLKGVCVHGKKKKCIIKLSIFGEFVLELCWFINVDKKCLMEDAIVTLLCSPYSFFMYVFMITGLSLLMFIINYVYTTVVRRVSSQVV